MLENTFSVSCVVMRPQQSARAHRQHATRTTHTNAIILAHSRFETHIYMKCVCVTVAVYIKVLKSCLMFTNPISSHLLFIPVPLVWVTVADLHVRFPVCRTTRVYKKTSPNSLLTLYLGTRDVICRQGSVEPLRGVIYIDPKFTPSNKIYGQLTLTFR